jgi:hypothetical protein
MSTILWQSLATLRAITSLPFSFFIELKSCFGFRLGFGLSKIVRIKDPNVLFCKLGLRSAADGFLTIVVGSCSLEASNSITYDFKIDSSSSSLITFRVPPLF